MADVMSKAEFRAVAEGLLDREEWFRRRIPVSDRERYVEALTSEIEEAAEAQLQHFRESLHVSFVGRDETSR